MSGITINASWFDLNTEDEERQIRIFGYAGLIRKTDYGWRAYVRRPDGTDTWDTVDTEDEAIDWVEHEILKGSVT